MEKFWLSIKESYNELMHKVTWPSWPNLLGSTRVVIVATIIIALIIFIMDAISNRGLGLIYGI